MGISFLLSITEPMVDTLDLVFEAVSAFSISGWSTGISAQLSWGGKLILAITMFAGRVGTLMITFALSSPKETVEYKYPKAQLMVG